MLIPKITNYHIDWKIKRNMLIFHLNLKNMRSFLNQNKYHNKYKKSTFFFPLYFWYYLSFLYKHLNLTIRLPIWKSTKANSHYACRQCCLEKKQNNQANKKRRKRQKLLPENQSPGFLDRGGGRWGGKGEKKA